MPFGLNNFNNDIFIFIQTNHERTSAVDLSQTSIIMNEPFPPELDFSQVVGKSQFNASQPPPPPPR